jgi:hypothetical protein
MGEARPAFSSRWMAVFHSIRRFNRVVSNDAFGASSPIRRVVSHRLQSAESGTPVLPTVYFANAFSPIKLSGREDLDD